MPRPKSEKWEPQFRPGTTPPGRRVVGRRGETSRNKLYAAIGGVAIVVLGAAAAGYVFLGGPAEPTPVAVAPSPRGHADPGTAPADHAGPHTGCRCDPGDSAGGSPGDGRGHGHPAAHRGRGARRLPPAPAPTPTPAPPAPEPVAASGDALALLRQGDLDGSARQSAADLAASAAGRFAIQALVACAPETVHKAVAAVGDDQLFILPVNYKGRDCHRICWGVFDQREAAEAAARSFPAYFRENGISPRIQPLVDLLP